MADAKHLVFVYGSLKQGLWNHTLLEDQNFLGHGITKSPFVLYDGGFPVLDIIRDLYEDRPSGYVIGELYEVDDKGFSRLDQLEGYPTFYDRIKIDVLLRGEVYSTWVYVGVAALDYRDELILPDEDEILQWPKQEEELRKAG